MKHNNYARKLVDYKKCMKVLDCAHLIYIDEISAFKFKGISKYNKSRYVYKKIESDFKKINFLIDEFDLFNAAAVMRAVYENIIYIIATSYDKKIKITLNTAPRELRNLIKKNCNCIFTGYFTEGDFDNIYDYLCKIVHPSSLKELTSFLDSKLKYKKYMLNNLKYIMIIIEYMYLDFLTKKAQKEDSKFDLNMADCCTYVNLVNISYFIEDLKDSATTLKRYLFYDTKNKYVEERTKICKQLSIEIKNNEYSIEKNVKELFKELDLQINNSKYVEQISQIMSKK